MKALIALTRRSWTPSQFAVGLLLAALGVAATSDAWKDLLQMALSSEEQSHVFLAPIVAGWLFWVRRERLRRLVPEGRWIGPVVVALGWLLWSFGDLTLTQAFWHAGAVLVVLGGLLSVLGTGFLRRFLPAFVVLAFMVPVPGLVREKIALPLQTITAQATHVMLDILGVDAARTGNVLVINEVRVAIAEACNGLRMVFALTLVSFAFAYGTPLRESVRVVIIVLSPVSAILCNVVRLVPTVWMFGRFEADTAETFHDVTGWIMLPLAFLLLLGIIRALRWALIPVQRFTLAYGA
jgi:exosortase